MGVAEKICQYWSLHKSFNENKELQKKFEELYDDIIKHVGVIVELVSFTGLSEQDIFIEGLNDLKEELKNKQNELDKNIKSIGSTLREYTDLFDYIARKNKTEIEQKDEKMLEMINKKDIDANFENLVNQVTESKKNEIKSSEEKNDMSTQSSKETSDGKNEKSSQSSQNNVEESHRIENRPKFM